MSDAPEDGPGERLRELESAGPPRLVDTPVWVRPFGTVLVIALIVISVMAAVGANPW